MCPEWESTSDSSPKSFVSAKWRARLCTTPRFPHGVRFRERARARTRLSGAASARRTPTGSHPAAINQHHTSYIYTLMFIVETTVVSTAAFNLPATTNCHHRVCEVARNRAPLVTHRTAWAVAAGFWTGDKSPWLCRHGTHVGVYPDGASDYSSEPHAEQCWQYINITPIVEYQ